MASPGRPRMDTVAPATGRPSVVDDPAFQREAGAMEAPGQQGADATRRTMGPRHYEAAPYYYQPS